MDESRDVTRRTRLVRDKQMVKTKEGCRPYGTRLVDAPGCSRTRRRGASLSGQIQRESGFS